MHNGLSLICMKTLKPMKGNKMKKIISLFKRDYEGNHQVYDEVVPGAEWVLNGEGVATQKYDGTCCMVLNSELYGRYEVKKGVNVPIGFIPAQEPDKITGNQTGWVKCDRANPKWKYHFEAFDRRNYENGTYELCGTKVQNNPENYTGHCLVSHSDALIFPDCPRTFNELKKWLEPLDIEGIVWHHPDGRMVKIKKKDFGLSRINKGGQNANDPR